MNGKGDIVAHDLYGRILKYVGEDKPGTLVLGAQNFADPTKWKIADNIQVTACRTPQSTR